MSDVFMSSTATVSTKSALFVAWGQLLTYDMSLTVDNASEPFDIACDDGGGGLDVWCPLGAVSDDIRFDRSDAAVGLDSVRSPVNYATSYIDLDFMYGRSEEEAKGFRTMEGGLMNVTDTGVPFQNVDGTWMVSLAAVRTVRTRHTLPKAWLMSGLYAKMVDVISIYAVPKWARTYLYRVVGSVGPTGPNTPSY